MLGSFIISTLLMSAGICMIAFAVVYLHGEFRKPADETKTSEMFAAGGFIVFGSFLILLAIGIVITIGVRSVIGV